MKKFKTPLIVVTLLVVVFIAGSIALSFIDPNTFKPFIVKEVQLATGRELNIAGALKWRFRPNINLEITQIEVKNANGFSGPFLNIDSALLSPKWTALLTGKLLLSLELKKTELHLTTVASGKNNWSDLQEKLQTSKSNGKQPSVLISGLYFTDTELHWLDRQKNHAYALKIPELRAENLEKGLLGTSIPLSANMIFQFDRNLPLSLKLNMNWRLFHKAQTLEGEKLRIKASLPGTSSFDLKGHFQVTQLQAEPVLKGEAEVSDFALANWIQALQGKRIQKNVSSLAQLKMSIQAKKDRFTINPYTLKIANGTHTGQLNILMQGKTPQVTLTQEANNFDVQELLLLLQQPDKLQGKASTKVQLSSVGSNLDQWIDNLSGKLSIQIEKGNFLGINLLELLEHARESVKKLGESFSGKNIPLNLASFLGSEILEWKQQKQSTADLKTPFDSLVGHASISQGVLNNPDLKILHPQYQITGNGTISLPKRNIQYDIAALLLSSQTASSSKISDVLRNTPLTIRVYGALDNPTIQPDLDKYARSVIKVTPAKIVEDLSEKLLEKVLGF